jgi:hypothetical protein
MTRKNIVNFLDKLVFMAEQVIMSLHIMPLDTKFIQWNNPMENISILE